MVGWGDGGGGVKAMTTAEKDAFGNAAFEALDHPLVLGVMEEFAFNMHFTLEGLPRYGLRKVAHYAAIVARAHALGIDPDDLRATDDEAADTQMTLARAVVDAGKPVFVVVEERSHDQE